jgi:hypothetical protein
MEKEKRLCDDNMTSLLVREGNMFESKPINSNKMLNVIVVRYCLRSSIC